MLFGRAVDYCVEEKCPRREIDHGRTGDTNRIDVSTWKTGSNSGPDIALPCHSTGSGIERIDIVGFGDRNDHRPVWASFDVKRLRINIAGDRAVEIQVARQVRCRGRRKWRVNVNAGWGCTVVPLRDVHLRLCMDRT